jgi:hypothetical protein
MKTKICSIAAAVLVALAAAPAALPNNQDADGGGCYGDTCAVYGDGCIVAWSGEQSCAR